LSGSSIASPTYLANLDLTIAATMTADDQTSSPAHVSRGDRETLVLGIETSCDETAAAVVGRHRNGQGRVLSNVVRSQWAEHAPFGGVVPELAARAHVECLDDIVREAMATAGIGFADLDGVAVTAGPGLIGGLMVGVMTAKAIAAVHRVPLIGVNHLEAHALTVGLTEALQPPYLLLLVSGGHTQLLLVHGVGNYTRLGSTIDDALGEAFDKTAKLLGLTAPGGPAVEQAARAGQVGQFSLPRPMMGRAEPNFSFAGLKTAVRLAAQSRLPLTDQTISDLCADFQLAAADSVADRVARAMDMSEAWLGAGEPRALVVAGGVAANATLRARLVTLSAARGYSLHIPPIQLCGDNGVMIAWAGLAMMAHEPARYAPSSRGDDTIEARARWPLDATAAPVLGAGRLGAKA
jgi:N6-L-threonylcarbamoyladenine synthase